MVDVCIGASLHKSNLESINRRNKPSTNCNPLSIYLVLAGGDTFLVDVTEDVADVTEAFVAEDVVEVEVEFAIAVAEGE